MLMSQERSPVLPRGTYKQSLLSDIPWDSQVVWSMRNLEVRKLLVTPAWTVGHLGGHSDDHTLVLAGCTVLHMEGRGVMKSIGNGEGPCGPHLHPGGFDLFYSILTPEIHSLICHVELSEP